jgi:hypothetical protein
MRETKNFGVDLVYRRCRECRAYYAHEENLSSACGRCVLAQLQRCESRVQEERAAGERLARSNRALRGALKRRKR